MKLFLKKYLLPTLPWFILAYLLFFTYANFIIIPYFDFHFESDYAIVAIYAENDETDLAIGDKILEINGISTPELKNNLLLYRYESIETGKPFNLKYERDGKEFISEQISKSFGIDEFYARLSSQWWFSYVFWAAGLITFLNVRPKNTIWRLLVAFFFLISIWMMSSSGFSSNQYAGSAIILRIGMFLTFPVIVHLHWLYPIPMNLKKNTPRWILAVYIFAIVSAFLQIFQLIPSSFYVIAFLLSLALSLLLLLIRYFKFKEQRKSYAVIASFTIFAIMPGIFVSIANMFSIIVPYPLGGLTALAFPLIPIAYLYSINRQKLGKLEFRVNRLISLYLFTVFLGSFLIVLLPLMSQRYVISENGTLLAIFSSLFFSLFSISAYLPFQKFIEIRVLGIPLNIEELKNNFTAQLNTTFDNAKFKYLIEEQVSASFLIKQSILFEIENKQISVLYAQGIHSDSILEFSEIENIESDFSRYIHIHENNIIPQSIGWARLILPIKFEKQLIGIWIFGKRDPDDFYSAYDIEILQTLADQLAVTVINHQQSQHLRTLYQQNIDRHETERARLARELHDDTLNNLALIKQQSSNPKIVKAAESTISDLRKIIQGLRPEMLTYGGLATALEDLGDLLNERQNKVKIVTEIISEPTETEEKIELHIFRMVQQGCENTLQHAKADNLLISGSIKPNSIDLEVSDDGIGFSNSKLDFSKLLSEQHYGLAGMYERATLIDSNIHIESTLGTGTKIKITWKS